MCTNRHVHLGLILFRKPGMSDRSTIDSHELHVLATAAPVQRPHAEAQFDADRSAALTEAFRSNRAAIYAVARRLCGSDLAPDVTQEVFLRVWRNPSAFDASRGPISQYLLMVTRAVSIDHLRRDASRRARDTREVTVDRRPAVDTSERIIAAADRDRISDALAGLSGVEREAIIGAFYDHLTYRQVSVQLGVPEGTVKSRIRHALQKLRFELTDLAPFQPEPPRAVQ